MQPRTWRIVAVGVGSVLLALVLLNIAAALFANADQGFVGRPEPMLPDVYVVSRVTQPKAIEGPLHVGDRVRLEDSSLANRLRFLQQRPGDRFAFVGLTAGGATTHFFATMTPAPVPASFWALEVVAIAFAGVGLIVAARRPADPLARTMVVLFFSLGTLFVGPLPWLPIWFAGLTLLAALFARVYCGYAALALASTFPFRSTSGVRRILERANPWFMAFCLLTLFGSETLRLVFLRPAPDWLSALGIIESFVYFAAISAAFILAVRVSEPADRKRVQWVVWSLGVGFSGSLIALVQISLRVPFAEWEELLGLTLVAIPLGLGYAIVRHRVVDIGFVVNRALVFGTLSVIVVGAFMILEWALSTVAMRASHITSTSLEVALALGLGFSMRSLHARVDRLVEDLFFRERQEAEQALRTLARDVAYISEPGVAVARVQHELIARGGAGSAAIYAVDGPLAARIDPSRDGEGGVSIDDPALVRMRASRMPCALRSADSALHGDYAFPMLVRDTLVGAVVVGPKRNGEAYAPDEVATIEALALALGNALDALQNAALKREIARVLVDGAPLEALRRTIDAAAWIRDGAAQPTGPLGGLGE